MSNDEDRERILLAPNGQWSLENGNDETLAKAVDDDRLSQIEQFIAKRKAIAAEGLPKRRPPSDTPDVSNWKAVHTPSTRENKMDVRPTAGQVARVRNRLDAQEKATEPKVISREVILDRDPSKRYNAHVVAAKQGPRVEVRNPAGKPVPKPASPDVGPVRPTPRGSGPAKPGPVVERRKVVPNAKPLPSAEETARMVDDWREKKRGYDWRATQLAMDDPDAPKVRARGDLGSEFQETMAPQEFVEVDGKRIQQQRKGRFHGEGATTRGRVVDGKVEQHHWAWDKGEQKWKHLKTTFKSAPDDNHISDNKYSEEAENARRRDAQLARDAYKRDE